MSVLPPLIASLSSVHVLCAVVERTREKRAKHLSETDLAHIWTAVDDFPSLYLFEFQDLLAQRHGMVVSQSGLVRAFYVSSCHGSDLCVCACVWLFSV